MDDLEFSYPVSELIPSIVHRSLATIQAQGVDWGHAKIQTMAAWAYTKGLGSKIAILDTGIDYAHIDLNGRVLLNDSIDYTKSKYGFRDIQGHGTHCAGIAAASDNTTGYVGVAPEAKLLAIKVLGDSGSGTIANVVQGINYAVAKGANVISMSLGASGAIDSALKQAIDRAIAQNVIVVVAAGNSGPKVNTVGNPGNYVACVTVGATDSGNVVTSFSSRGSQVDVCAPGNQIVSTYPGNRYAVLSGTSMATPYVAGAAALFSAFIRSRTTVSAGKMQSLFELMLTSTCLDISVPGKDVNAGYGVIQIRAMLAKVHATYPVVTKAPVVPKATEDLVITEPCTVILTIQGLIAEVTIQNVTKAVIKTSV